MTLLGFMNIGWHSAAVGAVVSVLIILSHRWQGKHTLDHDRDGVQKCHTTDVPFIGGLVILLSILVPLFLARNGRPQLLVGHKLGFTNVNKIAKVRL